MGKRKAPQNQSTADKRRKVVPATNKRILEDDLIFLYSRPAGSANVITQEIDTVDADGDKGGVQDCDAQKSDETSSSEDDSGSEFEDVQPRKSKPTHNRRLRSTTTAPRARPGGIVEATNWLDDSDLEPCISDSDCTSGNMTSDDDANDDFCREDEDIRGVVNTQRSDVYASFCMRQNGEGDWTEDDNGLFFTNVDTGEQCQKTGRLAPSEGHIVKVVRSK